MRVCDRDWNEPLSAWLDDEVDAEERARVEAHLARCETCSSTASAYRALGSAMRAEAASEVPERVMARAREAIAGSKRAPPRRRWAWVAVAACAAAAVALIAFGRPSPPLDDALASELVGHHLRGFARSRPCELESHDPAAVGRWVEERLGYSVEVPTPEGVELIGARACVIGGQATAALLYRHDDVPMTIFVPPPGSEALASAERFASSGARCTEGPIGERICVGGASQPAFAVTHLPAQQVLSMFIR